MSQVILISDNEVINSLYEVNLRAYVGTNVTVKRSLHEAMKLIMLSPNVDAVICFRALNNEDNTIEKFHEFITTEGLVIPVVVLGEPKKPLSNTIVIKNKYDIQSLLRSVAKVLEITAKDMAQLQVPKYFPVPLKLFSQLKKSHCDIFFRSKKDDFEYEYFKIVEEDKDIGISLKKYHDEGVEHLYIDASERLRFIDKTSGLIVEALNRKDISTEERVVITTQGMGIVAEDIFENHVISEAVANISNACMHSVKEIVKDVPKIRNLLAMLIANKSDYVYKHSVLATYIATEIIKNISWGSQEQQDKIAFAFFFHDIYLVPVLKKYTDVFSEEDLLFKDNVEEADKKIVIEHAKMAGELVKTFPKCPMGADMIITQHHGMTGGQGFAVSYKDDISPLSKIMIIAEDAATGMLIKIEEGDKKNAVNKSVIIERLLERYRNHTYKKIIDALEHVQFS